VYCDLWSHNTVSGVDVVLQTLQLCSRNAAAASFAHIAALAATAEESLAERVWKLANGTLQILGEAPEIWGATMPLQGVAQVLHAALGRAVRPWLATGELDGRHAVMLLMAMASLCRQT